MWDRSPDYELDYSPDGKRIVFVNGQYHTLWKSKADGGQREQLTRGGLNPRQPHWSQRGDRIAFMGQTPEGRYRVFVIPATGGKAELLNDNGPNQGVPTWFPDDSRILFGERLGDRPPSQMRLHSLNVRTRAINDVEGTLALWSPRWSPDGTSMLAVTTDNRTIRVSDAAGRNWRDVASMLFVDNVTWSYDSSAIFFNGRLNQGDAGAIFRVSSYGGPVERLADLKNFQMPVENWFGVAADGTLLASENFERDEICELSFALH